MSIPKHQDMRLPLLEVSEDGDMHTLKECTEKLADSFQLTDEERNERLPKNKKRTRVYDRVYWAKTHLDVSGLIESLKRGEFRITEEGKRVLRQNLSKIDDAYLLKYAGYVAFLKRSGKKIISESDDSTSSFKELNTPLANDLLDKLKEMHFNLFEDSMLEFLFHIGYGVSKNSIKQNIIKTHDGGLDGYIELDTLGVDKIYIQAKRWDREPVRSQQIRDFSGAIDTQGGNKGIFITTSRFTPEARKCNEAIKNKSMRLIDGNELVKLMIESNFRF
ncbi:winged helix-turn-helix domain-containing protein [Peribacillus frigoritolerans]|uniref:restriction endonuclease n=1 Tax=Peribacillus frigoritolerans TaxID=450367 RepID=UPI002B24B371|nr:restriction endonuclease [Peribacillus frigoritolerans]MEB2630669.1 winged helix-turn-helix domain-containing protein [Peribacillus frigoritolerans]